MHLHYKWSQRETTSAEEAIQHLKDENIVLSVVIGTPAEMALELKQLMPQQVVAIFSPYKAGGDWHRWAYDKSVIERARVALESGLYDGIGELHLIGGFTPPLRKNYVLNELMKLAGKHQVPIMLHTEFSNTKYLLSVCHQYSRVKIIWAHAGSIISPEQVEEVLNSCNNVSADLAARDPWRFVNNPITDEDGQLFSEWRNLFIKYPDRFMLGSDPVWPVDQLDRWDEPDTGWQELHRFWSYHRNWLKQLPEIVSRKIRLDNARKIFQATSNRSE